MPNSEVLFVCRENIGRSQVAMSFYNHFLGEGYASSAGTNVDIPGQTVGERPEANEVIQVMKEAEFADIDISKNIRTQCTKELIKDFGRTILLLSNYDVVPDWAQNCELWETQDLKGLSIAQTRLVCREIKWKTFDLVIKRHNNLVLW